MMYKQIKGNLLGGVPVAGMCSMRNPIFYYVVLSLTLLTACSLHTANIKNEKQGELVASYRLEETGEKKFKLDSETATQPMYMQLYKDESGKDLLTLLNTYNHSIYIYDYADGTYLNRIPYNREGPNGILSPQAYYIKNWDSIYVYDGMKIEIALTDSSGVCQNRIPLKTSMDSKWSLYYPQYEFSTLNPIIEHQHTLALTGFAPFSLREENIGSFRFTAYIDLATNQVEYHHLYPNELYGHGYNWEGGFATIVYPCLSPDGKLIHSFPPSHDLYLSEWKSEKQTTVYGGSNVAGNIHSIDSDPLKTPHKLIMENILGQDFYGGILYDAWREMYYRFLLPAIPGATHETPIGDKKISVILMDKNFNYLGETAIGTYKDWKWENSFVTAEGLHIEYIDRNDAEEEYLNFKIFIPQKMN